MSQKIQLTQDQLEQIKQEAFERGKDYMRQAWLSPAEVAFRIGFTKKHIWNMVKANKINKPSYSAGERSPRWSAAYIDEFMGGIK